MEPVHLNGQLGDIYTRGDWDIRRYQEYSYHAAASGEGTMNIDVVCEGNMVESGVPDQYCSSSSIHKVQRVKTH